jgi:hypothetical protein
MNARELPVIETPDQARERFASWDSLPSDDWLYFGTVHHHCSASAFQSATDEQNEWNQDGLHITVGNMDADRHDLHARLYLGGNCFDPDMSLFWQIDPELAVQVPPEMLDELACFQMCGKVTVDFPDSWRKNIIETQREPHHSKTERRWDLDEPAAWPLMQRLDAAVEDISRSCEFSSIADDQCIAALTMLANGETERVIVEACVKHGVTPDEILEAMEEFAPEDRFAGL